MGEHKVVVYDVGACDGGEYGLGGLLCMREKACTGRGGVGWESARCGSVLGGGVQCGGVRFGGVGGGGGAGWCANWRCTRWKCGRWVPGVGLGGIRYQEW